MSDLKRGKDRAKIVAAIAAIAVFVLLVWALRMRNWMPFAIAGATYLGVLMGTWPIRRKARPVTLPDEIAREDFELALGSMTNGIARFREAAREGLAVDRPMFRQMAKLVKSIRTHHEANPLHAQRTRTFVRNTLPRIVDAVGTYLELRKRAGTDHYRRLSDVSRQMQAFVPVLEKIDRACVENDVMALEINVEVLNEQLDRDRR
ncbi:MAG: 5-bromo-4-chloroindolyl phosphate hydrolysis family protein [Pseudomonadota bacterium]